MIGGAEERSGVAAAPAVVAVVASGEAAVSAGHVRAAPVHDRDPETRGRPLDDALAAARRGWRHVIAAPGQRVGVVVAAADADELVDLVVVRRDVLVADRPGDLPAVPLRPLEIHLGV